MPLFVLLQQKIPAFRCRFSRNDSLKMTFVTPPSTQGVRVIEKYIKLIEFASEAHTGQYVPGTSHPYLLHLNKTAWEIIEALKHHPEKDAFLAIHAAFLHDSIEDTRVTREILTQEFGISVADAVESLTKDTSLVPEERIIDSIKRIKKQPPEVWMVKMADRISNLSKPPSFWSLEKISRYIEESRLILKELGPASVYLGERLRSKTEEYSRLYFSEAEPEKKSSLKEVDKNSNFIRIEGFKGKIYNPSPVSETLKKHPCRDCFSCRFCADTACNVCLKKK